MKEDINKNKTLKVMKENMDVFTPNFRVEKTFPTRYIAESLQRKKPVNMTGCMKTIRRRLNDPSSRKPLSNGLGNTQSERRYPAGGLDDRIELR